MDSRIPQSANKRGQERLVAQIMGVGKSLKPFIKQSIGYLFRSQIVFFLSLLSQWTHFGLLTNCGYKQYVDNDGTI